jgi:hypothetical protein
MPHKFQLGDEVRDTVTGFKGIITCRNEWLNGCLQYCVKGKVKKDGSIPEGEWIDEGQLAIVKAAKKKARKKVSPGGGRRENPQG